MIHKCKLCGIDFETQTHNNYICENPHYINCRICGKPVYMNGEENKKRRKMYFNKGYVYCSHQCSCKGIGMDKYNNANKDIDLEKLKYLKTQTNMFDIEIAKELGISVDCVRDRCIRNGWVRPDDLQKDTIKNRNRKISNSLNERYKNQINKNSMLELSRQTYKAKTGYNHIFENPEFKKTSQNTKLKRYRKCYIHKSREDEANTIK